MNVPYSATLRFAIRAVLALCFLFPVSEAALAQTTLVLDEPGAEFTDDTTIRGGGYAGVNYGSSGELVTKTASDSNNVRRILLKIDTANTIPAGTKISSAVLTLTLKSAGAASSRPIGVYRVTKSFLEREATWYDYRWSNDWSSAGGDLSERAATAYASRSPGSKVSFDLTDHVQQTINGAFSSRWTRIALVDVGSPDNESMRVFYSSRAGDASVRPRLVITYGSSTSTSTSTSSTSSSSGDLKVMTYNTHHGVGTDGRYDLNRVASVIANQRPDVVALQEVMYNSSYGNGENQPETYKRLLESKTGQRWYYVYARMDGNWSSTSWAVGNMLLSRFPFNTYNRYALSYDRSVAQATIVVNGRTINLFSTHVDYANSSYRTTQTKQLRTWAGSWAENRIIMGDMNTNPKTSDYYLLADYYYDAWAEAVRNGSYSAPTGSAGYTHGGSRFDYIYESKGASGLKLVKAWVINTSSGGAKPSDHDPVVATFAIQ